MTISPVLCPRGLPAPLSRHICNKALITSVEVSSGILDMIIRSGVLRDRNHLILSEHRAAWFLQLSSVSYYRIHYWEGGKQFRPSSSCLLLKQTFLRNIGGTSVHIWSDKAIKIHIDLIMNWHRGGSCHQVMQKQSVLLVEAEHCISITHCAINSQWQGGNEALCTESHLPLCTMTQWGSTDLWKTHKHSLCLLASEK